MTGGEGCKPHETIASSGKTEMIIKMERTDIGLYIIEFQICRNLWDHCNPVLMENCSRSIS